MNKLIKVLLIFLMFFQTAESQPFFKRVVGGTGLDEVNDIANDTAGNIYSTGYFSSPLSQFGNSFLTNTSSSNTSDVFVTKSFSNGDVVWVKKIGGANQDRGKAIAVDRAGNIFVTGTFIQSVSFGPGLTLLADSGSADIFICKYDNSGNFLWAINVGGPLGDEVYDLALDNKGNVIITGQYKANAHFGTATATSALDTTGLAYSFDIFVLKLSGSGTLKWLKTGAAEYNDRGTALAVDSFDNVFLTGQFSDTIQFAQTYPNNVFNTCFVMKMDSLGNELNMVKFSASSSLVNSICVNSNNEVLFCGEFTGNLLFLTTPIQQIINPFSRKIYIAKFDNNLNFIYCNAYGSTKSITGKRIAVGSDLSYYVFGEFKCTFSQFSDFYGTGIFNSIGHQDLYVAKFANAGTPIWQRHLGGRENDYANGLVTDNLNRPIIAGSFIDELYYPNRFATVNPFDILNVPTFCNDNRYNRYDSLISHGYGDGFISNAIDTVRQPFDFYLRNGSPACQRQKLSPCIVDADTNLFYYRMVCSDDTVNVCDSAQFKVNYKVQENASPTFTNTWSMGTSYDNGFSVSINTPGTLIMTSTSADGCYIDKDTLVINISESPDPPLLSDNLGFNNESPPPTLPITYCSSTLLNTVISASGVVSPNILSWMPLIGANGNDYTVTNEPIVSAIVTSPSGCWSANAIFLNIDSILPEVNGYSLEPDTINLCSGSVYNYQLAEAHWLPVESYNTELTVNCSVNGVFAWSDIEDYNTYTGIDSATFVTPVLFDTSGIYNFTWEFIRTNPCGSDYDIITRTHYINVSQGVTITPDVDELEVCALQTITLSAESVVPVNWSMPLFPDTMAPSITVPGFFGNYIASFSLPENSLGYAQVCADTIRFIPYVRPTLIAAPSDAYICPGDSVQLTMIFENAVSYEWYGPGGLMPNYTGSTAYATVEGAYYCEVMNSDSCTIQSLIKIVRPYNTPYLLVDPPSNMVCYGNPATITVICNDNALIVWNSPLIGNQTSQIVSQPGVYSCTATSCGITTYCSITIMGSNTNINLTILGPDTVETCNGQSATLIASATSGVNFTWNNGSTNSSCTATVDGDYYVTATDPSGCSVSSEDVNVIINPVFPPIQIASQTVCYGDTIILNANTQYPVNWYSDPNGTNVIGTSSLYTLNNVTNSSTLYVQALENPVCPTPIVPVQVNLNTNIAAPLIYGNLVMCNLNPITLTTDTIGITQYFWSGPNGFTSNASQITVNIVGLYSLYVNRNGCNSIIRYITVTNISAPTPTFIGDSTLCTGTNAFFGGNSPLPGTWNYIDNNNVVQSGSSVSISSVQLANNGNYQFYYSYQGCQSETLSVDVTVNTTNPNPSVVGDTVCYNATAILTANSNFNINWYSNTAGTQFISTGNNLNINNVQTGSTVYAQAIGICPSSLVPAEIVLNPAAIAPIIYGNTAMCNLQPISLTTDLNSNYLFYWAGPNGYTASTGSAAVSAVGQYTLSVDRGNCLSVPASVSVTNISAPAPGLIGDTTFCTGNVMQLSANSIYSNVSWFNVSNTGTVNTGSSFTINEVQLIDNGIYQFFYDYQGCRSDTLSVDVTVNPTNPDPSVVGDTVCYNATAILFADSIFPINWYNNAVGTEFIGTGNNIQLNNVLSGFTVYAQAAGICPSSLIPTQIVMDPAAIAPSIYGNLAICNFVPITLTTDTSANYIYYWFGPAGYTANTGFAAVSSVGQYTLNVDRENCLSLPAYATVTNITAPAPGFTGDTTLCTGDELLLSANSIYSTVSWYNVSNTGTVGSSSIVNIPITQLADTSTYYFYYDYIGCRSDTAAVHVYINNVPVVTLDSALAVCVGQSITVSPTYSFCDSLYWVFPNSTILNSNTLQFAAADTAMSGLYTFHAGIVGCFNDTSTIRLTVNYTYPPQILSTYNLCENDEVLFDISNDNSTTTYQWIGSNNANFYTYGDTIFRNITLGDSAVYQIIATANGCLSDTATIEVNIQATPPAIPIYSNLPVCVGSDVFLWTNNSAIYNSHWSGPGNFVATNDSITLDGFGSNSGAYILYAQSSFGCEGPATSQNVYFNPLPNVRLGNDTTICDYMPFALGLSQSYVSQLWSTNETSEQILVDSSGTYWVQVSDENGCVNRDSININVLRCNLILGNVFTPDENGLNEMFFKGGEDLKEFHLIVYDRWGKKVYETYSVGGKWTCDCVAGTYFYVIDAVDSNDKKGEWRGFISLFR
jgi:hypothetical protein